MKIGNEIIIIIASSPKYMIMFLHLKTVRRPSHVCIAKKAALVLLFHHLVLFQSKVFLHVLSGHYCSHIFNKGSLLLTVGSIDN